MAWGGTGFKASPGIVANGGLDDSAFFAGTRQGPRTFSGRRATFGCTCAESSSLHPSCNPERQACATFGCTCAERSSATAPASAEGLCASYSGRLANRSSRSGSPGRNMNVQPPFQLAHLTKIRFQPFRSFIVV